MEEKRNLKPTIGLEIHVELETDSKMFCRCQAKHFKVKPNSNTCPICLGLPGALPFANKKAIDWTMMIGMALNCKINKYSKFDRKHYFYPDLPKGYQITQYDIPICENGYVETSGRKVRIKRVHLEEDTGKLKHKSLKGKDISMIDFNRSGVPLVEIVTEPDIKSAKQAKMFAQNLKTIIKSLKVSSCDMEKGSMRLEANISMGLNLGYKVEIKNLNSFRFIEKAIDYEIQRQMKVFEKRKKPKQETRGWNAKESKTTPQRFKETEADYRYFPEPDIPPIEIKDKKINEIKSKLPQLPGDKAINLVKRYGIKKEYAKIISLDEAVFDYSNNLLKQAKDNNLEPNKLLSIIVNRKIDIKKVKPNELIENILKERDEKISDVEKITVLVDGVIKENKKVVEDFRSGKTNAISVLIGSVMKKSKGKADPKIVRKILLKKL